MTITINIPDAVATRVFNGFASAQGYQATIVSVIQPAWGEFGGTRRRRDQGCEVGAGFQRAGTKSGMS